MREIKPKKQFRLYDIYRYMALKEVSLIRGLDTYAISDDMSKFTVIFENGFIFTRYYCGSEKDLKEIVKYVNKHLNNCNAPGPKRFNGKQVRFKI